MCIHVHLYMCTYVCPCVWKPVWYHAIPGLFSSFYLFIYLQQGLSLNSVHQLARHAGQRIPRLLSPPPWCWITGVHCQVQLFTWGLRIWTPVFLLVWLALYKWSHLSRPIAHSYSAVLSDHTDIHSPKRKKAQKEKFIWRECKLELWYVIRSNLDRFQYDRIIH